LNAKEPHTSIDGGKEKLKTKFLSATKNEFYKEYCYHWNKKNASTISTRPVKRKFEFNKNANTWNNRMAVD
jgi:hypothetical protein